MDMAVVATIVQAWFWNWSLQELFSVTRRFLPLNPNKYGAFADLPDYTFLDGRPTPLGPSRLKRALKQREFAVSDAHVEDCGVGKV